MRKIQHAQPWNIYRKVTSQADLRFRCVGFHGWYVILGVVPSSADFEPKSAAINNIAACQSLLYLASRS